jgi:predicted RNA-binding protein with PUA-like domain
VISLPYPDPKEEEEKLAVVDVKLVRALARPVTLAEIKADPAFAGWDLLRLGRLSVVPVSDRIWERVEEVAKMTD